MRKKIWPLNVAVERAVVGAVANVRSGGRRRQAMEKFVRSYAPAAVLAKSDDLETQSMLAVRALGYKSARRLVTWFNDVRRDEAHAAIPTGVPKVKGVENMMKGQLTC